MVGGGYGGLRVQWQGHWDQMWGLITLSEGEWYGHKGEGIRS